MTKEEMKTLERRFDRAMIKVYLDAKDAGHNAKAFFRMLEDRRGLATAKYLINQPAPSDGYTALWKLKRLDITVEAVIFDNQEWHPLFSAAELQRLTARLRDYEYPPALAAR